MSVVRVNVILRVPQRSTKLRSWGEAVHSYRACPAGVVQT